MESRLSKVIDGVYFKLRYAIWGPEVPFTDGTHIPEGREVRVEQEVEWDFPEKSRL